MLGLCLYIYGGGYISFLIYIFLNVSSDSYRGTEKDGTNYIAFREFRIRNFISVQVAV